MKPNWCWENSFSKKEGICLSICFSLNNNNIAWIIKLAWTITKPFKVWSSISCAIGSNLSIEESWDSSYIWEKAI